jgi:hypothetical protein
MWAHAGHWVLTNAVPAVVVPLGTALLVVRVLLGGWPTSSDLFGRGELLLVAAVLAGVTLAQLTVLLWRAATWGFKAGNPRVPRWVKGTAAVAILPLAVLAALYFALVALQVVAGGELHVQTVVRDSVIIFGGVVLCSAGCTAIWEL